VVGVATRDVFSEQELARLRGFPEITRAELIRYFTLTSADEGFVGRFLGQRNVLGASVQLCTLPWLGFVPDDVSSAPPEAVARLAERLGVASAQLRGYGERAQTRTDHLREVLRYAGWRLVGAPEWKQLDEFLIARAMEHDSPKVLLGSVCEYLISERVARPGVVLLLEHVAAARERARRETWTLLAPQLADAARRTELDGMLVVDPALGGTPLAWLEAGPTSASPAVVKTELAKLAYLRGLDAHTLDLSVLPAQRRRFLAGLGRRLTAQALARREPERRYPILLTLLAESVTDVLDEVVLLFDQALSGRESAAQTRLTEQLAERARGGEDRQALLDEILEIALDTGIADEDLGGLMRTQIGMDRMRAARAARRERLPRDHGHLALLHASMSYLRQFAPPVLGAVRFAGGPGTEQLMAAVEMLCELSTTGTRKVPTGAPTGFVPTRWQGYLTTASEAGDVTSYRHYWELCVLLALRDGLRCGDVFVPGSRRYADPTQFLLTAQQWQPRRGAYCQLVDKPLDAGEAIAAATAELHTALADLDAQLAVGQPGQVRLGPDGELIIPPLTAEDVPTEAEALRDELAAMLPRVPLASVLVEVDARTGFTDHLVHAGGKVNRPAEVKRNLLYVIIAEATNMGLTEMAASAGVSYDALAWTAEWYFRPRHPGSGQRRDRGLSPPAAVGGGVRHRHPGLLRRAAVPGQGKVDHRPAPVALLRPRAGDQRLHRSVRSARHPRHEGHRRDRPGRPSGPGCDPGQHRPAHPGARDRYARGHARELRVVRPGRQTAVPADPGPGQDHPVSARAALGVRHPLPARGSTALAPAQHPTGVVTVG